MSKFFIVVFVLSLFCSFLSGLIFTGSVSLAGIYNKDSFLGDLAMWLSAFGTVGTLIFLSSQHIQNMNERKKDKLKEKEYKESKMALDLYLSTTDTLIALISNVDKNRSLVFEHFPTFCKTLKKLATEMTEDAHISTAEIKHQELIVNLDYLYLDLKVGDIFMTLDEKVRRQSFFAVSNSFTHSSDALVNIWLKYVISNLESETQPYLTYGFGGAFIDDKYLYSFMALLVSNPKKEMLTYYDVHKQFKAFNLWSNKNENHAITVDNEWLIDLERNYPLLFANFVLKNIGFKVKKQATLKFKKKSKSIYYPQFTIHGDVPKHGLDNIWFILNRPTMTAYLPIPDKLAQTKEKFIVRLNTKED